MSLLVEYSATEPITNELVFVLVPEDDDMPWYDIYTGWSLCVTGDGRVGFAGSSIPDLQNKLRTMADWLERDATLDIHHHAAGEV